MAAIGVGINEDVVITKVSMDEKNRLQIELKGSSEAGKSISAFDALTSAGVQDDNSSFTYKFLSFLLPNKSDKTEEQKIDLVSGDIKKLRNQLTHILSLYMVLGDIDLHQMDVQFANTGINSSESYAARILNQDVLDTIYQNIAKRFIELITPYLDTPLPVRFKFIRQSKDKHFASIPGRFISEQPFIEPMSVPKEQSRVKFTPYEISQGLNDGTPIKADTAEKKAVTTEVNPFASAQ